MSSETMTANQPPRPGVIGILPAAGRGSRLGHLPCSKEILPLSADYDVAGNPRLWVLSDCALAEFRRAGIAQITIVTAPHKQDIPAYFGRGERYQASFSYIYLDSPNTPASVAAALCDNPGSDVALGFPDILYGNDNAFSGLLEEMRRSKADVVLGLYPTEYSHLVDMVACDGNGQVTGLLIKPQQSPRSYRYCWLSAVWGPSFSEFLLQNLADASERALAQNKELYMGDLFIQALAAGLIVRGVAVADTPCLDAGTPVTYAQALRQGRPLPFDYIPTDVSNN